MISGRYPSIKAYFPILFGVLLGLLFILFNIESVFSVQYLRDELLSPPDMKWPPVGTSQKYPVTRDTWISSVGEEKYGSNGGTGKLKVKGQQEYSIIDINASSLKGKIVTGALLHLRSVSPEKAPVARLSVSSVASEWVEGTSWRYRKQDGSSCFTQAEYRKRDWSYPGSTFMDVTLGRGHTIWKFAECGKPDKDGWQACAVDPNVIAARVAGLSHGFSLYDDVGSTWSIKKGAFKYNYFPNRFFYSSESGRSALWLEIWTNGEDSTPPGQIESIKVETDHLPDGEALVRWKTPEDKGGGKTLGFNVTYERKGIAVETMPRYLIPVAGYAGEEVRMHIQDLPFMPGEEIELVISPVDNTGNIGKPFKKTIKLSTGSNITEIKKADIKPYQNDSVSLNVGDIKVSVMDLLDKVDPRNGKLIPERKARYKNANHIFSASKKQVRLQAARNETVYFQVNLEGERNDISLNYTYRQNPKLKPKVYQFAYVNVLDENGKITSVLPDPLIQLNNTVSIPSKAGHVIVPEQTNISLICELYVPHGENPGTKNGKIVISIGEDVLEIDVNLTVWNFTLPNKLSFVPEMNAYRRVSPYKSYDYYRLAHEHRTCINRLPYGWHGHNEFAPEWDGGRFAWSEWDRNVGPLLDGSAFNDLPRSNEPVDVFYLPFNENWPVNIFENYEPSYWPEEAFSDRYKKELGNAFTDYAKHIYGNKWHDTIFQFYLNNKVYYKSKMKKSSAPWILDEPVNTQDFWALRWYGILWHTSVDAVKGEAKMWFRGDISFNEYGRNILWGIMDIEYVGKNNLQKTRMKKDEQTLWGKSYFAEYGTANKIESSNTQPVLWCLSAWSKGASGVLPWQTIGNENSWKIAQQTSLFYPHHDGPRASVRLKAFTVGQQLVEYLTLVSNVTGKPKFAVAEWLMKQIDLDGIINRTNESDAGTAMFNDSDVLKLWEIRYTLGSFLSEKAPEYKRFLVDFNTNNRHMKKLPDIGYVNIAPQVESLKPDAVSFSP